MLHKFEKVIAKHGFKLNQMIKKEFCGRGYFDYVYRHPDHAGRIVITFWDNALKADDECHHFFVQSNGITAPSICATGPQLDRDLTRNYAIKT
jgi:hypothetical protein